MAADLVESISRPLTATEKDELRVDPFGVSWWGDGYPELGGEPPASLDEPNGRGLAFITAEEFQALFGHNSQP